MRFITGLGAVACIGFVAASPPPLTSSGVGAQPQAFSQRNTTANLYWKTWADKNFNGLGERKSHHWPNHGYTAAIDRAKVPEVFSTPHDRFFCRSSRCAPARETKAREWLAADVGSEPKRAAADQEIESEVTSGTAEDDVKFPGEGKFGRLRTNRLTTATTPSPEPSLTTHSSSVPELRKNTFERRPFAPRRPPSYYKVQKWLAENPQPIPKGVRMAG